MRGPAARSTRAISCASLPSPITHASLMRANVHLLENFARRGHRFGEHGRFIGDAARHAMQIHDGQGQKLREGAVMADDPQHAPPRAMRRDSSTAITASFGESKPRAGQIDFSHDAPPDPAAILRATDAHYFAHEFVPERAVKIVIPAQDFHVGIANSRPGAHAPAPIRAAIAARLFAPSQHGSDV